MSIEPDATTAVELPGWRSVAPADRVPGVLAEIGGSGNGATGFRGALRARGLGLLALRTVRRRRPPAAVTPIQSSE